MPPYKAPAIAGILFIFVAVSTTAAQTTQACPRFEPGSVVTEPVHLYSSAGVLRLDLTYQTRIDSFGNTLYCYMTPDGVESPTLHVKPGDRLIINFTNAVPADHSAHPMHAMPGMIVTGSVSDQCGAVVMDATSTNIHYHGTNTPPTCHQDEVIRTLVNSGQSFQYDLQFPDDEPPGLYWYHPHVHGISEAAVQGGASGALIVDGIENINPAVVGLPQRTLIIRDNQVPGAPDDDQVPAWDISLNYIPVPWPNFTPAILPMKAGEKQFWRVANAGADTILDLQLTYDNKPQVLQLVALDGVPVGSQDGTATGTLVDVKHILLPPAARAEFIVVPPDANVHEALLKTLNVDTGPDGDVDPERPIARIQLTAADAAPVLTTGKQTGKPNKQRFQGLPGAKVTATRTLFFWEEPSNPNDPDSEPNFFITVDGKTPVLFNPNNPPAIVTTQGSVEDWTIENRTMETHAFHIHQIHFLQVGENRRPVKNGQYLDMINVPYWKGHGPYPSVTIRMDFRGPDIGDFVYHCHILEHEDNGMMAIIRVLPPNPAP